MTEIKSEKADHRIELCFELDASAQKVWRALSIPAFRARWLPDGDLADCDAVSVRSGEYITYRMRDSTPPFLESSVTFVIAANKKGGTSLRIIQQLSDLRLAKMKQDAANTHGTYLMLAA